MYWSGCRFGPDVCRAFLKDNNLSLIIRSHEAVPEGFDWPYGSGKMLLTIFSATNYGGVKSDGAYISFDSALHPIITTYTSHPNMKDFVKDRERASSSTTGGSPTPGIDRLYLSMSLCIIY